MTDALNNSIRQAVRRPEVIDALCTALEVQLRAQLGGEKVYVQKRVDRAERDQLIRAQFNGKNQAELAQKHGVTVRHVNRILAARRKKRDISG
jgi:Mor family transcriptional regulator